MKIPAACSHIAGLDRRIQNIELDFKTGCVFGLNSRLGSGLEELFQTRMPE